MPGKRTRKDSGSTGTPSSSVPPGGNDPSPSRGAGSSSSSGSVGDDSEDTAMKACCLPTGCPFGEEVQSEECLMVKLICNYDACTMSQYMHAECFSHWEEGILNFLRSHGRARSWSEKQRRQNLWTKRGYDLAYRACACKCKHGHLRKDLDWNPQATTSTSEQDAANAKKKNRKKHKDLPTLGGGKFNGIANKTKSKPIPSNKDSRMRHSSTSSIVSVDQGYISASPGTSEMGPYVFSPPSHHHRSVFSFHNTQMPVTRGSNGFVAPSTSPLPEIPDDGPLLSPQLTPSPTSTDTSLTSPPGVFTPPISPEIDAKLEVRQPDEIMSLDFSEIQRLFPKAAEHQAKCTQDDIQAMTALIDNLWRRDRSDTSPPYPQQAHLDRQRQNMSLNDQTLAQMLSGNHALAQIPQPLCPDSYPINSPAYPQVPFNSPTIAANHLEKYQPSQTGSDQNTWANLLTSQFNDVMGRDQRQFNSNSQVLLALRQKEQKEIEKRELNKYIVSMMSVGESKTQAFTIPNDKARHNSHTEIRLVPMRSTTFAKRYDFSLFESVLPLQHINPYHIKMEGEGYGSDDLRNFILSSLSKAKCAQMNCVVCGVDLPVYDHFPLVDGTMFLSPERNERSTRNCFKIKVEGKCDYVHAACMRCLEGLHNIVCRMCNTRWEGMHHQLGTLYMYDIFAASPCCQHRLCCKQCGGAVVDIRQGLTYFSEYSTQKTCPRCHATDYHFVRPITTYQLMGLVFS